MISNVNDAINTSPMVPEKYIARAELPNTSSYQLARRLLMVQMIVLFEARRRVTLFAPFGVGDFLRRHVESDNLQVLGEGSLRSHTILLHGRQDIFGLQHVLGCLRVSELVLHSIQNHGLQRIVNTEAKGSMDRFPELGLMPSHVNMTDNALNR
jgi:hypothetical protein